MLQTLSVRSSGCEKKPEEPEVTHNRKQKSWIGSCGIWHREFLFSFFSQWISEDVRSDRAADSLKWCNIVHASLSRPLQTWTRCQSRKQSIQTLLSCGSYSGQRVCFWFQEEKGYNKVCGCYLYTYIYILTFKSAHHYGVGVWISLTGAVMRLISQATNPYVYSSGILFLLWGSSADPPIGLCTAACFISYSIIGQLEEEEEHEAVAHQCSPDTFSPSTLTQSMALPDETKIRLLTFT